WKDVALGPSCCRRRSYRGRPSAMRRPSTAAPGPTGLTGRSRRGPADGVDRRPIGHAPDNTVGQEDHSSSGAVGAYLEAIRAYDGPDRPYPTAGSWSAAFTTGVAYGVRRPRRRADAAPAPSPAAIGVALGLGQLLDVDPDHGVAQAAGDTGNDGGV